MNRIFLSRDGKSFGPFSPEDLAGMRTRGELSAYQWIYDDPAQGWKPVAPPPAAPPVPPLETIVESATAIEATPTPQPTPVRREDPAAARNWLAMLHDGRTLLSGRVIESTAQGCRVEAQAPNPTLPSFRVGTQLTLNLLDPDTNQAENMKITVDAVERGPHGWTYLLRWARAPRLASLTVLLALLLAAPFAEAAPPPATGTPAPTSAPAGGGKRLDVDGLKEKYWNNESSPELRVVQNRTYTKDLKISVEPFFSMISADPFLSVLGVGVEAGFNFTEYLGVHAIYSRFWSTNSGAADAFLTAANFGANSNRVNHLLGGEVSWSVLYGKLSLIGKAILHFDLMVNGGAGYLHTDNGPAFTPWLGLGQQIYIFKWMTIRADYRFMYWRETVTNKYTPTIPIGQVLGPRDVFAHWFTAGVTFLFP